jgi:hypothetical protein
VVARENEQHSQPVRVGEVRAADVERVRCVVNGAAVGPLSAIRLSAARPAVAPDAARTKRRTVRVGKAACILTRATEVNTTGAEFLGAPRACPVRRPAHLI